MNANILPIPDIVATDAKAFEVLRVWIAQGDQHVSLAAGLWKDPAAWGIMLVDLAKHIAASYEPASEEDYFAILATIHQGFEAEWAEATDEPKGINTDP